MAVSASDKFVMLWYFTVIGWMSKSMVSERRLEFEKGDDLKPTNNLLSRMRTMKGKGR